MKYYDLCLTWSWKYDADFVRLLESACRARRLTFLQVTPESVEQALAELAAGQLTFRAHFDFSAHQAYFEPLFRWAREQGIQRINPPEIGDWAEDKATMHLELINAGVHTPYTIILPPFDEQPALPHVDLGLIGVPFVIKPSYGGGGEGVVLGATSLEQVCQARSQFPDLKYLLQEQIQSRELDGRQAWFRMIYCAGRFYPCWWNTRTHVYTPVTTDEQTRFGLAPLQEITARIAQVCKLDFFSTEIAHTPDGRWVAVDYVNDQIDLRLQSQTPDGVPDAIVANIAADLAALVAKQRPRPWFERLASRFLMPKA
jgi:glutathione synthase/RimK-type ligase-like ATP-grasp enzyme